MISVSHAVKRRHGLALAAGSDEREVARAESLDIADIDECSLREMHIPQLARRAHDIQHAASGKRHTSAVRYRYIYYLLHAVYV